MSPLAIIWNPKLFEWKEYVTRHTARAVLFRDDGKIAILHVWRYNYHKLPWGWIEEWEDFETALRRECLEEVWAEITIGKYIGEVVEYRANLWGEEWDYVLQISRCYLGTITNQWEHNFTEQEEEDDFSHRWFSLEEAITTLKNDTPENEEWKYILQRELTFLKNI